VIEPAPPRAKRAALLIEEGFDARDVQEIRGALTAAGLTVVLVAPVADRPYRDRLLSTELTADLAMNSARIADFDAVVIPGGHAADRLRLRHALLDLATDAVAAGKPLAAIAHGPQLLISANLLRGRTITCWPSIAVDVKNAGALYVDRPVVNDGNIITARKSDDLPQFIDAILTALAKPH
jgi:protease I